MEEIQHVCRLCKKNFSSGKSLGGHMRGHCAENVITKEETEQSNNNNNNNGYVLRENPKKSWKFSRFSNDHTPATSTNAESIQEASCKACGKEFGSLRALFGHMRHHSAKDKKGIHCKECDKGFQSLRALTVHMMRSHSEKFGAFNENQCSVGESLTDNKTKNLVRRKRSIRYKLNPTTSSSVSSFNESSSVNEFGDDEVEDVAMCLMMLSRGVHNWVGFNFESSVDSEVKSVTKGKIRVLDNPDHEEEEEEEEEGGEEEDDRSYVRKRKKLRNGCVSDSFDGFSVKKKNSNSNFSKTEDDDESEVFLSESDSEIIKSTEGVDQTENCMIKDGGFNSKAPNSEPRFKCRICNKMFSSYQALGGHQTVHRLNKGCIETKPLDDHDDENEDRSIVVGVAAADHSDCSDKAVEMSKERKCPVCFKVFGSGQALGGHKKSHHSRNSKGKCEEVILEVSGVSDELELEVELDRNRNLPSMVDEEESDEVEEKNGEFVCLVSN